MELRTRAMEVLQQHDEMNELVQLIGRGSLSEADKVLVDVARLLTDDFLQQNGHAAYDRFCPFYKTYGMLRNITGFHELAKKAVTRVDCDCSWDVLRAKLKNLLHRLGIMKFLCPNADGEKVIMKELNSLWADIQLAFEEL